jgi:hypothetical protein
MKLTKNCSFSLSIPCQYNLADIQGLWIADTKDSEFIIDSNKILDIINVTWYRIYFSDFKLTQNISIGEEIVLDIQIPFLNSENQSKLNSIKKNIYSFLLLDKNNNLFYIDKTKNNNYIETYNPNGFTIKQIATGIKSLFQVDYNYYLFNFIGVSDVIDVCEPYYNTPCLDMEIQINQMDCPISEFGGTWF